MKFSSALALGAAPLALAKAAHNVYSVKRSSDGVMANTVQLSSNPNSLESLLGLGMSGVGLTKEKGTAVKTDIIVIWLNQGGGAATTQINRQETVTVTTTVTDGGAAATPAPAQGGSVVVPPGTGVTHNVTVGGPKGLIFEPNEIKAKVGDMVIFKFLSQNHTVTQSGFDTPCDPLAGGMDSGFQANPNNTVNPAPLVAMQVMVETPLWFYCRAAQGAHCGKGMVFSINPTAEKTHSEFAAKAIASKGLGSGGAITGNPSGGGAAAPPAANPAAPAASSSPSPAPATGGAATDPSKPTTGTGTLQPDGSCQCVVTCAAGSFPAMGVQGLNNFGGMAGSIPANMVGM
ncbi:hypothetical protein MCOR25_004858 [Pyricularia grisea]|uniref:Phytocyanin domain-containing protein n=1 Tax=Pyricularia grisea TaxID=148305 RepID=A0A6P8BKZ2_PYRGI|nr:uncharacterized protein PgNI_00235 [Pyricularia grisea]KAI6367636.1 hypothetical protein MCOR25_004858 [Pyricularia grisea]TLD17468.1 hypothetical protein PgNI_00235 [Pyricularia grisea]